MKRCFGEVAYQQAGRLGDWLDLSELVPLVAGIATRHGLTSQDADDILQETLISLLRAGPDVHVSRAWIYKVAGRKAIDVLRRSASQAKRDEAYACRNRRADNTPELEHLLHARVAELPARIRTFYELHYIQGLSEREIAALMAISRGSVRWLDSRCRRALLGDSGHPSAALGGHGSHALVTSSDATLRSAD